MIKTNQIQSMSGETFNVEELSTLGGKGQTWQSGPADGGALGNSVVHLNNTGRPIVLSFTSAASHSGWITIRVKTETSSDFIVCSSTHLSEQHHKWISSIIPDKAEYSVNIDGAWGFAYWIELR